VETMWLRWRDKRLLLTRSYTDWAVEQADQNRKTNCEDERRQKYCQGLCALRRAFVNLALT
jgi:hypothetical protein